MKKLLIPLPALAVPLLLAVLLLSACTSFYNTVKKNEYAAATLADGGMKGYAVVWKDATNNPAAYNTTLPDLLTQRSNVMALSRKVGAGIITLDTALTIYQTNSATKPVVNSVLAALVGDAANIATFANLLKTSKSP